MGRRSMDKGTRRSGGDGWTDAAKGGVELVGVREESAEDGVRWGQMIGCRRH